LGLKVADVIRRNTLKNLPSVRDKKTGKFASITDKIKFLLIRQNIFSNGKIKLDNTRPHQNIRNEKKSMVSKHTGIFQCFERKQRNYIKRFFRKLKRIRES